LESEALALDAIVVTGTAGAARRREVGNTIAQINADDIIEPSMDFQSMIQGRGAGVSVTFGSGQLGDGAKIRLRGDVSNALNNNPLIYVDGIRVKNDAYDSLDPITLGQQYGTMQVSSPLSDINPNDIERVEIVKGAAATTLYGAEGAAGVIQIFTRRGLTGAPVWTAEIDQGFVDANKFGPTKTIRGVPMSEVNYQYTHGGTGEYNGLDGWFKSGWRQRYTLGVRGGTQDLRYFVSGTM
jgi:TonB-dependent SusC/RagA subfamily outer membrane receptor